MEVIADLHIHSRFSIATGQEADLEHLDLWGRYKGVQVVGTGDCTHPGWLKELEERLEPAAPGVYELKPSRRLPLNLKGPQWEGVPPVRFLFTGEISAIYKKGGHTRKVHLLVLLPSLEAAQKLSLRLGRLGNVTSDGRPILGLDARHLVELALEIDPDTLVIPAHIWTPWFSVLGAKSGFDTLTECFEDLVEHIYALETGLSSDPAMNWRVSQLDPFLLVSNSDAHSPQKIAREANIFLTAPTFPDLRRALVTREGFAGTLEFFPEEGKYHLDGHRKCGLSLTPEEARREQDRCPKCGRPLTGGVLHRVLDLADRAPGEPPPGARPYESLVPLPEVLSQILGVNPGSKKVSRGYFRLLERFGPELTILRRVPLTELAAAGLPLLAAALNKVRSGRVNLDPGYDGEYGKVRLFTPDELERLRGQEAFWQAPAPPPGPAATEAPPPLPTPPTLEEPAPENEPAAGADPILGGLNEAQQAAVTHQGPPLVVQAGPGTGKTRALTHRLAYLLSRRQVSPQEILALTFTRQAAQEVQSRILALLPHFPGLERLRVTTFHALGHRILREAGLEPREVASEEVRRSLVRRAAREHRVPPAALDRQIALSKQALLYPEDLSGDEALKWAQAFRAYEAWLTRESLWDYEDLISRPVRLLGQRPEVKAAYRTSFRHLLVDEYQDLNEAQYRLFQALAGPGAEIMVIGDPDQAIYGFRGARPEYFARFHQDWPGARVIRLNETYRLPPPVLDAARQVLAASGRPLSPLKTRCPGADPVILLEAETPDAEARAIARRIAALVGGLTHLSLEDPELRYREGQGPAGFREVAVLYRLNALGDALERHLTEAGIPWERPREGVGPELDGLDLKAERVKLLTLHAAKGLEFPYVFIAGCEEGLIPWEPEKDGYRDPEEERRLFYVGLTRASRQVFLTRARSRTLWGQKRRPGLSPFLAALKPETLLRPEPEKPAPRRGRQFSLF